MDDVKGQNGDSDWAERPFSSTGMMASFIRQCNTARDTKSVRALQQSPEQRALSFALIPKRFLTRNVLGWQFQTNLVTMNPASTPGRGRAVLDFAV